MRPSSAKTPISIFRKADDADGKASFFLNQNNKGDNQLVDETDSNQSNTINVTVATLMSVIQSNGITKIDAMKVDIEDHDTLSARGPN